MPGKLQWQLPRLLLLLNRHCQREADVETGSISFLTKLDKHCGAPADSLVSTASQLLTEILDAVVTFDDA